MRFLFSPTSSVGQDGVGCEQSASIGARSLGLEKPLDGWKRGKTFLSPFKLKEREPTGRLQDRPFIKVLGVVRPKNRSGVPSAAKARAQQRAGAAARAPRSNDPLCIWDRAELES